MQTRPNPKIRSEHKSLGLLFSSPAAPRCRARMASLGEDARSVSDAALLAVRVVPILSRCPRTTPATHGGRIG